MCSCSIFAYNHVPIYPAIAIVRAQETILWKWKCSQQKHIDTHTRSQQNVYHKNHWRKSLNELKRKLYLVYCNSNWKYNENCGQKHTHTHTIRFQSKYWMNDSLYFSSCFLLFLLQFYSLFFHSCFSPIQSNMYYKFLRNMFQFYFHFDQANALWYVWLWDSFESDMCKWVMDMDFWVFR